MKVTRFFIMQKTTDKFDALPVRPASTPSTPRRPRHYDNLHMSLEIPPEIALGTQISLTLTPHSTPVGARASRNNTPETLERSPTRAPPIPAPQFGPRSPSQPTTSTSEDPVADVKVETLTPHASPQMSSTQLSSPSSLSSPSPARRNRQRTDTVGQHISIVDNETFDLDPTWPVPVYLAMPGGQDSLPNVPVYPKKYYIIYKGLRPGIYYDIWQVHFTPNGQCLNVSMYIPQAKFGTPLQTTEGWEGLLGWFSYTPRSHYQFRERGKGHHPEYRPLLI
jgi:hypothetical protein